MEAEEAVAAFWLVLSPCCCCCCLAPSACRISNARVMNGTANAGEADELMDTPTRHDRCTRRPSDRARDTDDTAEEEEEEEEEGGAEEEED